MQKQPTTRTDIHMAANSRMNAGVGHQAFLSRDSEKAAMINSLLV
jgi:hypothetical protein